MNKEEFAVDEKTYENQDGMIIKIVFSNLGRRYKRIGNNLYLMLEKETAKLEDSLTAMVRITKENEEIDKSREIEKIKKHGIPVIFVTAKESVLDRVKGLRLGADDYIIKPFETIELLARIEVVLRRYNKNNNYIKFKNIEVDTKQRSVKLNDKEVYLTVKEYELLILLLQNKNMALSRDQILDRVWGFEYGGETRTVDIHIQRIREKLDLKNNIKTVFKVGYRLEE